MSIIYLFIYLFIRIYNRSSLDANLYQPTFAGFVDTDISNGKISLRTLVCMHAYFIKLYIYI
jgi:hypothetical protein